MPFSPLKIIHMGRRVQVWKGGGQVSITRERERKKEEGVEGGRKVGRTERRRREVERGKGRRHPFIILIYIFIVGEFPIFHVRGHLHFSVTCVTASLLISFSPPLLLIVYIRP
jgi:hypothetical protein